MAEENKEETIRPVNKITHTSSGFGAEVPLVGEEKPMPMAEASSKPGSKTIRAFEKEQQGQAKWKREPLKTGTGACHVRTFHSKLTSEGMIYMDQTINEWLDDNPDYEVKFVSSTVGEVSAKIKEPHLICQVWV